MAIKRGTYGWVDDDFVDGDMGHTHAAESDPWSLAEPETGSLVRHSSSNRVDDADAIERDSWGETDLIVEGPDDPWLVDFTEWEEPDPTVDASSDLSESLYTPDDTITNFSRELRIDELLAQVHPLTEGQRAKCRDLLSALTVYRIRYLIPWLREHTWCGARLQLFLEFRDYWESRGEQGWWEWFYWDNGVDAWIPSYNKTTLTFDHARELVERRGCCPPADVIDGSWFEEWEDCAAWRAGVRSFASFAVFRAGIPNGQDWRELLFPTDKRTALEIEQCGDRTFAPFMLPSLIDQYGCHRALDGAADSWLGLSNLAYGNDATSRDGLVQALQQVIVRMGHC